MHLNKIVMFLLIVGLIACGGGGGSSDSGSTNSAPVVPAISDTIYRAETGSYALSGSDADGDALTYVITTDSTNAHVEIVGDTLLYYPASGYTGTDTFSYAAHDGNITGASQDVTIDVMHDPDADPYLVSAAAIHSETSTGFYRRYYEGLSDNGRYAYYQSRNVNLNDSGYPVYLYYRHDLQTGERMLINQDASGTIFSINLLTAISGNGRYVCFRTSHPGLVASDTGVSTDCYRLDLDTHTFYRFNLHSNGTPANQKFYSNYGNMGISDDGNKIVFLSEAKDLIDSDANGTTADAFMHNVADGTTVLISKYPGGSQPGTATEFVSLSRDGQTAAFSVDDGSGALQVYAYDSVTGNTELASLRDGSLSVTANDHCIMPEISGDGKRVLFGSQADNLHADESDAYYDIFIRDLDTHETIWVTRDSNDSKIGANVTIFGTSHRKFDLSFDGALVAFVSYDEDTLPEDSNGEWDVLLKDLNDGSLTLVSQHDGVLGNGYSNAVHMSDDGSQVLFDSMASNLVELDNNGMYDVFVRDFNKDTLIVLDKTKQTMATAAASSDMDYSGRYVVFQTRTNNIVSPVLSGSSAYNVYLHDCSMSTTSSLYEVNENSTYGANDPCIDDAASMVCFRSRSSNMISADPSGDDQIYGVELSSGIISRLSRHSDGTNGNGDSSSPDLSPDGTCVVYASDSTNLVTIDANAKDDIFLTELSSGTTTLVSVHSDGTQANDHSDNPVASANGTVVAFDSEATNLVDTDTNSRKDVFIRTDGVTTLISRNADGTQGNDNSRGPSIDSAGRYVVFESRANTLVNADSGFYTDIFLYDINSDTLMLISKNTDGTIGNGSSFSPVINSDGNYVVYGSSATNLVGESTGSGNEAYVYDIVNDTTSILSSLINDQLAQTSSFNYSPMFSVSGDGTFAATAWNYQLWRFANPPAVIE